MHVATQEEFSQSVAPSEASARHARIWVPLGLLTVLCVRFTVTAAGPIKDPDAWWHLRMGHEFWSGDWTLRETGPLSSFATEKWAPRDWMPQLLASKFEDWFGLPGVAWLYGAALLVFLVASYVTCRRWADPLPAALATATAAVAASGSLSQRPQMISFILMFVVMGAWLASARDLKPRWWLVPLTWVWACAHGMWYCGIAVGVVVVAGLVLDRRASARQLLPLMAVPALSVVAAGVTPVGPHMWLTVFDTTGMWQFVDEWAAPSFRELAPAVALIMVLVVVASWSRRTTPTSWVDIGLLTVAIAWMLLAARTVPLAGVVLAPLVAGVLQGLIGRVYVGSLTRLECGVLGAVVTLNLAWLAMVVPSTSGTPGNVPNGLDDDLEALPGRSAIINEYVLGGWLHWRHPDLQTVVDGFTDGYTPSDVAAYGAAHAVSAGWEEYVTESGATSALLAVDSPLALALEDRLNWGVVGTDEGFVLLRSP